MSGSGGEITRLLAAASDDPGAIDDLFDEVHDRLEAMARARMRHERAGHTLDATALVNEAYMRLVGSEGVSFNDRAHFFRAAGEAMRRILIDHARKRGSQKRGGGWRASSLTAVEAIEAMDPLDAGALDEALNRLRNEDPRAYEVVQLRFFAGLTAPQVADLLGVTERTVHRDWAFARTRLFQLIEGEHERGPAGDAV